MPVLPCPECGIRVLACVKCYKIFVSGGSFKKHFQKCCGSTYQQSLSSRKRNNSGQFTGKRILPRFQIEGNVPDLANLVRTETTRVLKFPATSYRSSFVTGLVHPLTSAIAPPRGIVGEDEDFYTILQKVGSRHLIHTMHVGWDHGNSFTQRLGSRHLIHTMHIAIHSCCSTSKIRTSK